MFESLGLGNNNNNNNKYTFSDSNILVEVVNYLETVEAREISLVENKDVPFEEVIFNDGITDTASSLSEEGPKMVKKLGEMPSNERGLSNSVSLALFLAIDVVAIFVGLFLLMH